MRCNDIDSVIIYVGPVGVEITIWTVVALTVIMWLVSMLILFAFMV